MHFLTKLNCSSVKQFAHLARAMSTLAKKGLLLGVYEPETKDNGEVVLSSTSGQYDQNTNGKLAHLLKCTGIQNKKGKSRILYGLTEEYPCTSVANLGPSTAGYNELEEIEEGKENVRIAVASGVKQLREVGVTSIDVDPCGDAESVAEGATLALFSYDELKKKSSQKSKISIQLLDSSDQSLQAAWRRGVAKAEGQNLARRLMETPANLMTPTKFAETAQSLLKVSTVTVRDKEWIKAQKMGSFLSVTEGSEEPPVFLEISYMGGRPEVKPLVICGKGITFDSGGVCLKLSAGMDKMRGDMGGAACTLGAIYTLEQLGAEANVIGLIPLTENTINGKATKPGDVVTAMNGKTIQIDNTDAEGRLVLADALCYAHTFNPQAILDIATLTGAMVVALGTGATGVFTTSSQLWSLLHQSGKETGDRVWRMPAWSHYSRHVVDSHLADLNNISKFSRGDGGSCVAAAFLREFVSHQNWAHLDIAGVMEAKDDVPYLSKGMTGRPTRTLVEFITKLFSESSTK